MEPKLAVICHENATTSREDPGWQSIIVDYLFHTYILEMLPCNLIDCKSRFFSVQNGTQNGFFFSLSSLFSKKYILPWEKTDLLTVSSDRAVQ